MERDTLLQPGDTFMERWVVGGIVGQGGFSEVYRVEDETGRTGALKLLRDSNTSEVLVDIADRFLREAELLSQLDSPYTIQLWDHGDSPHGHYMLFEFIEGRSLFDEIKTHGALPEHRVVHILRQSLIGLEAAHAAGILHRDVKPNNIMLYERDEDPDRVKLIDFGIAKRFDGAGQDLTAAGLLVGTPRYMSPTQLRGGKLSPATDLYALGLCAVEMVTGRRCIQGNDRIEVVRQQLLPDPVRLADDVGISPRLVEIIHGMTEKDLSLRTASATEALRALEAHAGDPGTTGDTVFQTVPADFGKIADVEDEDESDETAVDAVSADVVDAMFGEDAELAEPSEVDPLGSTLAIAQPAALVAKLAETKDAGESLEEIVAIEPLDAPELPELAVERFDVGGPASDFLSQFSPPPEPEPEPEPVEPVAPEFGSEWGGLDSSFVSPPDHTPQSFANSGPIAPVAPAPPAPPQFQPQLAPGPQPAAPHNAALSGAMQSPYQPFAPSNVSGALHAPTPYQPSGQTPGYNVSGQIPGYNVSGQLQPQQPLHTPYGRSNYRPSGPLQGMPPAQPQRPPVRLSSEDKISLVTTFIVPGAGQVLVGQRAKGVVIIVVTLLVIVALSPILWALLAVASLLDTFLVIETQKRRRVESFEFFPDFQLYR